MIYGNKRNGAVATHFVREGTHQMTKLNFVLLAKESWDWSRPPLPFLSPSAVLLLQNFLPTSTDLRYPLKF